MSLEVQIIHLGKMSYQDAWSEQQRYLELRKQGLIDDTLLLVEHPPTISLGKNEEWNKLHYAVDVIKARGMQVVHSERGGGAAYLGDGQLVGYVIANILPYGGVLPFMQLLEEVMIRSAEEFNISVRRHDTRNPTTDKPYRATWFERDGKFYVLCTKGIGVQSFDGGYFSHHGFCLNIAKNHSYFDVLDPCGFPVADVPPISMEEILGKSVDMDTVKDVVSRQFRKLFKQSEVVVHASA
ncbi:MAG: hypothetical protein Q7R96_00285 [Nanoarchaeota archaeon]|nr:hypothetical protein [Nanoarchaeota archaeon]